jgi:hypothetical protein
MCGKVKRWIESELNLTSLTLTLSNFGIIDHEGVLPANLSVKSPIQGQSRAYPGHAHTQLEKPTPPREYVISRRPRFWSMYDAIYGRAADTH